MSMAQAKKNRAPLATTISQDSVRLTAPAGRARPAVRGLAASKRWSAMRLKVMAQVRAPTMARITQKNTRRLGRPRAARKAPMSAKGMANTVCWNLIISSRMASLRHMLTPPGRDGDLVDRFPSQSLTPMYTETMPKVSGRRDTVEKPASRIRAIRSAGS